MTMVFCKQRFDFVRKTTIEKFSKKAFQKPEHGKKYVFLAKCIENVVLRQKYCQQKRGNEPEKLKNKLLITDYAKVKTKEQKRWQPHASHDSLTFQGFKCGTRIQVFHDNNRDFRSRTLFVGGKRCPVALFKSFVERGPLLKHWPCDGLFFSTSVANETENLNIWFKLNQWANIP